MGWFSSSPSASPSTSPTSSNLSQDAVPPPPLRESRALCWSARDTFFDCLSTHGIIDSVKEDGKARAKCAPELREFEEKCKESWVTYFKKRRVMEYQREETLRKLSAEGAKPIDVSGEGGGKKGS